MNRVEYHKLVRDRIPEVIERAGRACATARLNEEDYRRALRAKLVEEAQEAMSASGDSLQTELADVLEVLDALAAAHGIPWEDVVRERDVRRLERGGFTKQIVLLWAEGDPGE